MKDILRAADETAANRLVQLVQSNDESIALKASIAVIERNHGKPVQALEHGGSGGVLSFQIVRKVSP